MVSYIILMVMDVCLIQCDFLCYFVKKVILLFLDFLKKSNYSEPSSKAIMALTILISLELQSVMVVLKWVTKPT